MAQNAIPNRQVQDLVPEVISALQGRTDVTSALAATYLRRSIQEISESNVFEELRRTGPTVALTTNVSIYPVSTFLNPGDEYTSNESFSIYVDYPTNTIVGPINYRTPNAIEPMLTLATNGVPSRWTRFGTNIHIGPTPTQPFSVFMRYQTKHTFTEDILSSPLYIPTSWEEVVVYAAALRIAIVKRWNDQAKVLHDILYGDPEFINSQGKRGRPGIIAARTLQVERDQKFNTRQVMPIIPRYTR